MPRIFNQIYCKDCLTLIDALDADTIDLVVTSPPYNVDLGNNKYKKDSYDLYNDNREHQDYISWLSTVFFHLFPKMKFGGRLALIIGDGKNGAVPTSSDVIQFMIRIGYIPYSHIIWDKKQTSNRAAWGSFLSPSSPSFPTPFEHILIFCKGSRKLQSKGKSDLTKKEFISWASAVWKIKPELRQKQFGHPSMFPEELPKRCIKMLSWIGATVLDPFNGAGTTTKVARDLGRSYIGGDISGDYCYTASKRLDM